MKGKTFLCPFEFRSPSRIDEAGNGDENENGEQFCQSGATRRDCADHVSLPPTFHLMADPAKPSAANYLVSEAHLLIDEVGIMIVTPISEGSKSLL